MKFDYDIYLSTIIPWFYGGMVLIFFSVVLFVYHNKKGYALLLLIAGNLLMSGSLSVMQPFLHLWDEQVHALVAKNMMSHPFKPMLMSHPNLDYNYKVWVGNHVWLHKQPWFLWQIALFFKIFGVSEFTLRLPSMLMFSLLLLIVYRMGILIKNKAVGFYAALLLAGCNFMLQLVTGAKSTDHNDVAFVFYVTASLWAWFEFETGRKKYWLIFIGLFSGIAILNKWLPGLLVYSGWFFAVLFSKEKRKLWQSYGEMLQSFFITVLTALPWQLYILRRFPLESRFEYQLNSVHFFRPVERHKGDYLFHFDHLHTLYGDYFKYILLAALILLPFLKIRKSFKIALFSWIIIVYGFYTVASTKMIGFPFIVAPLGYLAAGTGLDFVFNRLHSPDRFTEFVKKLKQPFTVIILYFMFFVFLNISALPLSASKPAGSLYETRIHNTLFYKKLPQLLSPGEYEFFNCKNFDHIKIMFYTGYNAHGFLPSIKQIDKLCKLDVTPVVFDYGDLPGWITDDKRIIKIKFYTRLQSKKGKYEIYR